MTEDSRLEQKQEIHLKKKEHELQRSVHRTFRRWRSAHQIQKLFRLPEKSITKRTVHNEWSAYQQTRKGTHEEEVQQEQAWGKQQTDEEEEIELLLVWVGSGLCVTTKTSSLLFVVKDFSNGEVFLDVGSGFLAVQCFIHVVFSRPFVRIQKRLVLFSN